MKRLWERPVDALTGGLDSRSKASETQPPHGAALALWLRRQLEAALLRPQADALLNEGWGRRTGSPPARAGFWKDDQGHHSHRWVGLSCS